MDPLIYAVPLTALLAFGGGWWLRERRMRTVRALVHAMPDIIALIGREGRLRLITPNVAHQLGYIADALIDTSPTELLHDDDKRQLAGRWQDALTSGADMQPFDIRVRHRDGHWLVYEVTVNNRLTDPLIDGLILSGRNVTGLRRTPAQIAAESAQAEALANLSQTLTGTNLDSDAILAQITERVTVLFGDMSLVRLLTPDRECLDLVACYHPNKERQERLMGCDQKQRMASDVGLDGRVVRNERPLAFQDIQVDEVTGTDAPELARALDVIGLTYYACVPIRSNGEIIGTLSVCRGPDRQPFDPDTLTYLQNMADLAALAIGSARLYRELEEELHRRQQIEAETRYLARLFQDVNDAVVSTDMDYRIRTWNRAAEKMYGYTAEEAIGQLVNNVLRTLFTESERFAAQEHLESSGSWRGEVIQHRRDGQPFNCLSSVSRLYDEAGNVIGSVAVNRDITERVAAVAAAQRGAAILEAVSEGTRLLLHTPDWERHIPSILAHLGHAANVSRVYIFEQLGDASLPIVSQRYEWVKAGVTPQIGEPMLQELDIVAAGMGRWYERLVAGELVAGRQSDFTPEEQAILAPQDIRSLVMAPIFVGARWWGFIGLDDCELEREWSESEKFALRAQAETISAALERRQAESALRQSQKLESIGLLAGGIAHDFNNLLTAMLGQTSLARARLADDAPERRHIEKAIQSAERAADLTRQLLAYAGKGQFEIQPLDLNGLVQENIGLLTTALPPRATLSLDLAPGLATVEADRGQMQQVVMNLVLNAIESLQESAGTIRISTFHRMGSELAADLSYGDPPGPDQAYVGFAVGDDGVGMTPETVNRIFDPFFSTKTDGRGLGLSATLGIVKTHGGLLHVTSDPGEGSEFTLYFPASDQAPAATRSDDRPTPKMNGVILLIDDEEPVREAVTEMLDMLGVEVLTAENGRIGLELFQTHRERIQGVVLDMHMPVMNGLETFQAIKEIAPETRVVLSSGYSEMEANRRFTGQGLTGFLQKPFNFDRLRDAIQEHLFPEE